MPNNIDRREFIKVAGAAVVGASAANHPASALGADGKGPAALIFKGGPIVTMVDGGPEVQAVAVSDGRILAAGSEADIMLLANDKTKIIDLKGATLMPSFIDAHGHFMNAPQLVTWANVSGVPVGPIKSIKDFVPVLQEHVKKLNIKPGEWIVGYGYDGTTLSDGRELSRDDLDPAFPDNPVMLMHVSNHGCVMNSKAFEWAKMDASTETPAGGIILRKKGSNEPDGLIMEQAFAPVFANWPKPTEEDLLNNMAGAQQIYASVGVTTCQEGGSHAADIKFLQTAAEKGLLYLDVVSLPFVMDVPAMVAEYFPSFVSEKKHELPDTAAEHFGTYKNRLKFAGIKIPTDGSPQGKTAFWTKPLLTPGPSGEKDWRGAPLFPPELVNKAVAEFFKKGVRIYVHCNGDASIDMVIDAVRAAGITAKDDRRTVIIHSQFMRPDQLDAYVELGLTPSFFTEHCYFWGDVHIENTGIERASFISPMASAKAKGIRFSNHNDFSVTPMEPMRQMWSAMKRETRSGKILGPNERIDAMTALKAMTIDAAWQILEENSKGTIEVGKLADLVILDANPLTTEVDKIVDIAVVETFKEGNSVYKKAG